MKLILCSLLLVLWAGCEEDDDENAAAAATTTSTDPASETDEDASVPSDPSGLSLTFTDSSTVVLSWSDASSDEDSFEVQRGNSSTSFSDLNSTSANVTTFSDTTVTAGTTYYYRIYAKNTAGNSNYDVSGSITPLAAPTNFASTQSSETKALLSWTDVSGETGYTIQRSTNGTTYSALTTVSANVTIYSDTSVSVGTTYYYRIKATNGDGSSSYATDNIAIADTTFDFGSVTYMSKSLDVSGEEGTPTGLAINADGTKFYVIGTANDTVYAYTLTTAFDVSTGSTNGNSLSVSARENVPTDMKFANGGTRLYIIGDQYDSVQQYNLSTAYDISTATYSTNYDPTSEVTSGRGFAISSDGTKMFVADSDAMIYQYSLSTAYDVSSASYDSVSYDASGQVGAGYTWGIGFNVDGTRLYVLSMTEKKVYQYIVASSYSLASISYDDAFTSSQSTLHHGFTTTADGTYMYMVSVNSDLVYQYSQ